MLYGALEAGGTKMVCAVGTEQGEILEQISIPTTTPAETMPPIIEYFKGKDIQALGIACFGPVDLDRNSPTYGWITTTPKIPGRIMISSGRCAKRSASPSALIRM